MIGTIGMFFARAARRYLPDAFIFAVILTIVTFILGMAVEGASFVDMASYFGDGLWSFLGFSMQMVLILVTGSALATSRPVSRLLRAIAKTARTPGQAVVLATLMMIVGCWLNWGFGLIISALLARELAKRVRGIHYPLLVASAYSGFIVWHAGFSGSIPLKIAGADEIMERFAGGVTVPASQTIFAWQNILLVLVFLCTLPFINRLMHPRCEHDIVPMDPGLDGDDHGVPVDAGGELTPAMRLERSRVLTAAIVAFCITYIVIYFGRGGTVTLNIVIFIFLTLGLMLHQTPIRYVRAVNEAVRTCGGIVLQFPFYAGIMGMMMKSGLAVTLSQIFVGISTGRTLPFFTYLSAGIVNFFVPSGGGQWAVQGPIMIPAAKALGVPYATTAMAIAWGDAWTNLVQPFWALPLLAVAGLRIRDIMGYTAVVMLYAGVITSLFMLFVF
ncbi:MAG TPA: TIGR00366 family protein [Patescibacteria group bacterium]|nr:TIGR00366 family protein [Patescibacteria group bacterium]